MPQVRAVASLRLQRKLAEIEDGADRGDDADVAHHAMLARDIARFFQRPANAFAAPNAPGAPPGAPIGEPAMLWLSSFEPICTWEDAGADW